MKIAIDLDGTAWKYQNLFIWIVWGLKGKADTQVGILTAHVNLKDADLNLWRQRGFWNPPDFYISKQPGEENIPSRDWKIQTAKKYNIDFIFDDFDTGEIQIIDVANQT